MSGGFSGAERLNAVINEIEAHICEPLDCAALARLCALSEYELRRVFSFFVGLPLAEYQRRRRLSLAAIELKGSRTDVTAIGQKYGYAIPSSFTRAFRELFGMTPSEAQDPACRLSLYTRPDFAIQISGGEDIPFTLRRDGSFAIDGISGSSDLTDTVCCESVWRLWEAEEHSEGDLYAAYFNGQSDVLCKIGRRTEGEDVPAALWAVFDLPESEHAVNDLYTAVLCRFLPSSGYRRAEGLPNLEFFPADGGVASVLIPIEKGE